MSDDNKPVNIIDRIPSNISGDDELELNYFQFQPPERMAKLLEKIMEAEKQAFDYEVAAAILDGNPGNVVDHKQPGNAAESKADTGTVYNAVCPCQVCELVRVKIVLSGAKYAIRKMRALYSRMQNN